MLSGIQVRRKGDDDRARANFNVCLNVTILVESRSRAERVWVKRFKFDLASYCCEALGSDGTCAFAIKDRHTVHIHFQIRSLVVCARRD